MFLAGNNYLIRVKKKNHIIHIHFIIDGANELVTQPNISYHFFTKWNEDYTFNFN